MQFVGRRLEPDSTPGTEREPALRVVFAGGGTGGHLAPGIALAEAIAGRVPSELTFLTTGRPVEQMMLADAQMRGIARSEVCPSAPPGGGLRGWARFGWRTLRGLETSIRALRRLRPHVVVGLGGYGALPVALAARVAGVPLVLMEQNVIPGRATRFLSRFASTVISQWPLPESSLRCPQSVRGNPVRAQVFAGDRQETLRALDLPLDRKTILLVGGSQGAAALNRWLIANRAQIGARADAVQVIAISGSAGFALTQKWMADTPNVRVLEFATDMGGLYAAADLVIARAGATTIAECTALGKPMALVPLPTSAEGHQLENALYCARAGAAVVLDQLESLDADAWHILLDGLLLDDWERYAMTDAANELGRPQASASAARDIAQMLLAQESLDLETGRKPVLAAGALPDLTPLVAPAPAQILAATPAGHPAESVATINTIDTNRHAA